ncbi:MAG: glutamate formimidoyltransferase [Candidatus Thermoplasmatota archaeon]|nr:glutamate formimidoyltransferase [Candidatus Thermoplasmatota archaeon]
MELVECVPNFSEGRDETVIGEITDEIESVDDVELKDVDMGEDTNRTVVTFVGPPEGVKKAAFDAVEKASELIDMSQHEGSHPRMGATDVCPFVPVKGVTMEDCVEIANEVGERVGEELDIPVYLYEEAATEEKRENLATIRSGQYEGLEEKLEDPEWKPDYGPSNWNDRVKKTGATVVGAREFLIAYNIDLNTTNKKIAWDIALELRDRGRAKRDGSPDDHYWKGQIVRYGEDEFPCGECDFKGESFEEVRRHTEEEHGYDLKEFLETEYDYDVEDLEDKAVKKRGKFDHCKAIGWYVEEYNRAQISINLTDYKETNLHDVYDAAKERAREMGAEITGSEIVGLAPYDALIRSGKYYLEKMGQPTGIPEQDIIETAVQSLGLRDVADFDPEEKLIGGPTKPEDSLVEMKTDEFVHEVSRDSSTPGGGSIAALSGSIAAALSSMVSNLSTGDRGTEDVDPKLIPAADRAQELKDELLRGVDEDTNAFDKYMEAKNMPKSTPEERDKRREAMEEGLKHAVKVPMETAETSAEVLELAEKAAEYGKEDAVSDALVSAQMAYSGVLGGIANVKINLQDVHDEEFIEDMLERCENLKEEAKEKKKEIIEKVDEQFEF